MAEEITHPFISNKTDSADSTLVSSGEWNDGHVLTGGLDGQYIVCDTTQANNMVFRNGPVVFSQSFDSAANLSSPHNTTPTLSVVTNSICTAIGVFHVMKYTSSGGVTATFEIKLNGNVVATYAGLASGANTGHNMPFIIPTIPSGSNTISATVTTVGNALITNLDYRFDVFVMGKR